LDQIIHFKRDIIFEVQSLSISLLYEEKPIIDCVNSLRAWSHNLLVWDMSLYKVYWNLREDLKHISSDID